MAARGTPGSSTSTVVALLTRFGLGGEPQRADFAPAESHRSAVHRDECGGSSDEGGVSSVVSDSEEDFRKKGGCGGSAPGRAGDSESECESESVSDSARGTGA